MYMVPVRGYDNFLAVSKFAEYLDSVSGALQDTEYCMKRAKIMAKHSRQIEPEQQLQEHPPEDEDDSDEDDDEQEENDDEPVAKKSKIEQQDVPSEVFGSLKKDE